MKPYGTLTLTTTSPPQAPEEPISLAEAKDWLNIEANRTDKNSQIELLIPAVRAEAEIQQGIDLVQKQWDLRHDGFPCGEINLRRPLQSVDSVQYTDSDGNTTTLVEDTDYVVDLARGVILPAYGTSWPSFTPAPSSAVLVRFTSGYSPDDVFWSSEGAGLYQRMQFAIVRLFDRRDEFDISEIAQVLGYGATPRA